MMTRISLSQKYFLFALSSNFLHVHIPFIFVYKPTFFRRNFGLNVEVFAEYSEKTFSKTFNTLHFLYSEEEFFDINTPI